MAFTITVLNDGDQAALHHEDFARALTKPSFPSNPREFQVVPAEGVVAAQGSLKIKVGDLSTLIARCSTGIQRLSDDSQVIYTANIARVGQTTIEVDMWDSDSDPVTLPVTFCGKVASLSVTPLDITVRFCFVNFPYSRSFVVTNNSDLDGFFYLLSQPVTSDCNEN